MHRQSGWMVPSLCQYWRCQHHPSQLVSRKITLNWSKILNLDIIASPRIQYKTFLRIKDIYWSSFTVWSVFQKIFGTALKISEWRSSTASENFTENFRMVKFNRGWKVHWKFQNDEVQPRVKISLKISEWWSSTEGGAKHGAVSLGVDDPLLRRSLLSCREYSLK